MAATGKQLKQSVKVFHNLMLYRRLPTQNKKKIKKKIMQDLKLQICLGFLLEASFVLTLIIKAIDSINRGAFMVATQQEKVLWVFNLIG